jgi:starch synthase
MITIHNGLYQSNSGFDKLHYLPEFDLTHVNVLEWDHCINFGCRDSAHGQ